MRMVRLFDNIISQSCYHVYIFDSSRVSRSPQTAQCERCAATTLDWQAASGDATLVSWTVSHVRPGTGPVVLCIAELAEGPWWWSRLEDCSPHVAATRALWLSLRALSAISTAKCRSSRPNGRIAPSSAAAARSGWKRTVALQSGLLPAIDQRSLSACPTSGPRELALGDGHPNYSLILGVTVISSLSS